MPTINLKEHYPTAYSEDFFIDVTDEIHQLFVELKNYEGAIARKISRYHAYLSLDDPNSLAEQHLVNINHTILALSPKQAKRCYDYFYCGISMPIIAEKEGVTVGSVSESIKSALINLRERCNLFNEP